MFFFPKYPVAWLLCVIPFAFGTCYIRNTGLLSLLQEPTSNVTTAHPVEPVAPNLKVAFIGDSGYSANFEAVLRLIKAERADLVLHQGDFDYERDADGFFAKIDAILGADFPYFIAVGNHDVKSWATGCGDTDGCYADFQKARLARLNLTPDHPDLDDQMYTVTYRGLKLVFVGQEPGAGDHTYAPYIQSQLASDTHQWKICSWHRNQHAMQLGTKTDDMGWAVYETCKEHGALIVTGHEHSYTRTKTLVQMADQTVDTQQHPVVDGIPSNPDHLLVGPGRSFVIVSGLGGHEMRNQDRCPPFTYPYGGEPTCNYMWAKIYSSDQTGGVEKFGALFIVFNDKGNPTKARGYFKTTDGAMIDEFDITQVGAALTQ